MVPDCRQYGSKKLDKAEILEMSIDYIQKMQRQSGVGSGSTAGLDLSLNQREWANDLTTWVINNKVMYTGGNALDQFCQALLLHLQGMGSGNALASATSMLLNQVREGGGEGGEGRGGEGRGGKGDLNFLSVNNVLWYSLTTPTHPRPMLTVKRMPC